MGYRLIYASDLCIIDGEKNQAAVAGEHTFKAGGVPIQYQSEKQGTNFMSEAAWSTLRK